MSQEYNLSIIEAANAAIDGKMVVGEGFERGVVMIGGLDKEARLLHFDKETREATTDTRVILTRDMLNMKYRMIESISEIFH